MGHHASVTGPVGGATRGVAGGLWQFPSGAQCLQRHISVGGRPGLERPLGPETRRLAADFVYPGARRADQYRTLHALGYLEGPAEAPVEAFPRLDDPDLDAVARAYLDVNCASCHQPDGPGRGGLDLRFDTPLELAGLCGALPVDGTLGIADARIVAPGAPERSVLLSRMKAEDHRRMPPLGTRFVDEAGAALIEAWIDALDTCD